MRKIKIKIFPLWGTTIHVNMTVRIVQAETFLLIPYGKFSLKDHGKRDNSWKIKNSHEDRNRCNQAAVARSH